MSIVNVYAIRDNKIGAYGTPFCSQSDVTATRSLIRAVQDDTLQLSMFAEDFDLYTFGRFDDSTGHFDLLEAPKFVCSAVSLRSCLPKPQSPDPDPDGKALIV